MEPGATVIGPYKAYIEKDEQPTEVWQAFCAEHPDEEARPIRTSELSAKRDATKHNKAEHSS